VRRAALAVWDFVVGDDPLVALGVVVALAVTGLIADTAVPAWWVLPVAVALLLTDSLRRALRR
jgi:hypothetical protein